MKITDDQFRKTMGLFPTGVTVMTVPHGKGQDVGITISSFTSLSLNPPQILFCLSKHSKTLPVFKMSQYFAANILSANQSYLSDNYAKHEPLPWQVFKTHRHGGTGCLLFSEALGHVVCEKGVIYEGGDHEIIVGKVIDLSANGEDLSLIRQRGRYLTTQPISFDIICGRAHNEPT